RRVLRSMRPRRRLRMRRPRPHLRRGQRPVALPHPPRPRRDGGRPVIYALIGAIAFAASLAIVAAMAGDDVDHYTQPERDRGGQYYSTQAHEQDGGTDG